jgi:undecaprenyl-diphosphatase
MVSIVPAGLVGFFFENIIETTLRSAFVVSISLVFWGIILGLADRYGNSLDSEEKKGLEEISWSQVIFISIAQAIALIPGTSRSGITMTAGLFSKLKRTTAAEFSFLMGIPIIGLAGVLKLWEFYNSGLSELSMQTLTLGFVISAVSGVLAIWGLLKIIKKWTYLPFAVYRVVVGILIFLFIV